MRRDFGQPSFSGPRRVRRLPKFIQFRPDCQPQRGAKMNAKQAEYYRQSLVALKIVIDEVIQINKDLEALSLGIKSINDNLREYISKNRMIVSYYQTQDRELEKLVRALQNTGRPKQKNTAYYHPYIIDEWTNGTIQVRKGGVVASNTIRALREIATTLGISTVRDNGQNYTTRELGRQVIRAINEKGEQLIELHNYDYESKWYWVLHTSEQRKAAIASCYEISEERCRRKVKMLQEDRILPNCKIVAIGNSGQQPPPDMPPC